MKRNILPVLAAMMAFPLAAQQATWERSLTVEGQYNPNTGRENKLMPVPESSAATPESKPPFSYITEEPARAELEPRGMSVLSKTSNDPAYPSFDGSASLGYGLRNAADGSVELVWRLSQRDRLLFNAGFDNYSAVTEGWRQRLAGTQAGISYLHSFDILDLGAFGTLNCSQRNFRRGTVGRLVEIGSDSLLQRSLYGIYGMQASSKPGSGIQWTFGFSYENLERRGLTIYDYTPDNDEAIFRISASAAIPFDFGTVSVDYRQKSVNRNWTGVYGHVYGNFSTFTLTPRWETSIGAIKTDFGINLDFRSAMGEAFMFSPDISAEYGINSQFTVWGRLDGGLEEHSMYSLSLISPYWSEQRAVCDGYTLARFESGLRYSLPSVLTAGVRLGTRYTKDELFQVADSKGMIVTSKLMQDNASVIWTGFDVAWAMGGRFDAKAALVLYSWTGRYDEYLLSYKPAAEAQIFAHANVCRSVDVSAEYRWQRFMLNYGDRLNSVNELDLRADWQIRNNLSLYLKGANLLGCNFQYWAGYRALKPYAMLGATVKF